MRSGAWGWRGFSLVEILMAITLAGVLLSLAVPGFRKFTLDARRTAVLNELLGSIHEARSETLKRAQYVTLCPSANGNQCSITAGDWGKGWLLYANADRTYTGLEPDPGEQVLRYVQNPHDDVRIASAGRVAFSFRPFTLRSDNGTFTLCDRRGASQPGERRAIVVNAVGRPRITTKKADGTDLVCP